MWKCSVCGRENNRMVCRTCGQLECEDLLALRSLMPVTKDDVKTQKARIREWKQEGRGQRPVKKYLQAGLAAAAAICILVLGIRIGSAGKTPAPAPTETLPPVLEAETTEAPAPETTIPETVPATIPETIPETEPPEWINNVLMEDSWESMGIKSLESGKEGELPVLGSSYQRQDIKTITFVNLYDIESIPDGCWDVSLAENNAVLAWVEDGQHLYIGGKSGIRAPWNCSELFYAYANVTAIQFNGLFHTDMTESFCNMFRENTKLTSVDLADWNTSQVTDMSAMFYKCGGLTALDLSGWNTYQVTDMSWMFYECGSLTSLDLSGWDTSQVTNMRGIFGNCLALGTLDLSGWDTSQVTDMGYMFYECGSLTVLELSGWDTSQATDMSAMFYKCGGLTALDLSGWDTSQVKDMAFMFTGCPHTHSFNFGTWETDSVTEYENFMNFSYLFNGQPWQNLFKK